MLDGVDGLDGCPAPFLSELFFGTFGDAAADNVAAGNFFVALFLFEEDIFSN